jgi:hypothetical protein
MRRTASRRRSPAGALAAYTRALSLVKDPGQNKRIEGVVARLKAP